jgi:hypothetical protein
MIYHASILLNHGWHGYEGKGPNSQQAGIDLLAPATRYSCGAAIGFLPTRFPLAFPFLSHLLAQYAPFR